MIPNPITQGISSVASTVGSFLDRPKPNAPVIQVANPAELTPRIEPAGAAVGSPVPVQQNPFAFPSSYCKYASWCSGSSSYSRSTTI